MNRVRHAGLGGLEYFDSMMLMGTNERFVIVNTKTGNLVGTDGARNATEGLRSSKNDILMLFLEFSFFFCEHYQAEYLNAGGNCNPS